MIDATEMRRRRNIRLARNDVAWQQTVVSFALSGIEVTEENEEIAGRMLSGEIASEQAIEIIRKQQGVKVVKAET